LKKENILISSTGIIGKRLPIYKIYLALPLLIKKLSREGIHKAKKAGEHFDLRLENDDGTMSSWAIPKARLPHNKEKLLAQKTEDHPISYNKFKGEIPEGGPRDAEGRIPIDRDRVPGRAAHGSHPCFGNRGIEGREPLQEVPEGRPVRAQIVNIDEQGRIRLSLTALRENLERAGFAHVKVWLNSPPQQRGENVIFRGARRVLFKWIPFKWFFEREVFAVGVKPAR
jgi:hypothetical protein